MAKKKEIKQIFENLEVESSDARSAEIEASQQEGKQQISSPDVEQVVDEEGNLRAEMLAAEQEGPSGQEAEEQVSAAEEQVAPGGQIPSTGSVASSGQEPEEEDLEDALDDVRKSLLEEESQEPDTKWWKRIGRSSRKKKEEESVTPLEEINLPALTAMQAADAESGVMEPEPDEYQEKLDELIDLLDTEEEPTEEDRTVVPYGTSVQPEPEPEPEKPVDLEELKKQAFQPRTVEDENLTEVRSIALGGEEDVFVEVEASKPDVLEERLSAAENALKPYQRYIYFALAFLGVVMAALAVFAIYNAYQRSVARNAPVQEVSNLPYPTTVGLPGGWNFNLGKGSLTSDGNWNPSGAEWLQGTEVCRWVALPYSRQLEAVLRTLNSGDPIQLGMSNNDQLTYDVNSIKQMSPAEMQNLDSNKPCLLIVLAEQGADKRWVLTALP